MNILFVCLGNICRSPIAEGIAREYIKRNNLNIIVDSAGTAGYHIGEPPCENSIKIAQQKDIDISNLKARQLSSEDFNKFDMIVGLDSSNITNIIKIGYANPYLLGDFGLDGDDVPDPYFFDGFEGFDKVFDMIETAVINLLNSIK
ncbi:MAG: low molecular weight protein-tyrosine-phosphatase [Arcobacteraceae bacterium]|jgi:protein-tyrosine phosphatase|nr:low molecular weight phosphotyrosine protein phosphatase [Arcobacteraceae bacterium]MDY0365621.1 low molecular weight protein-tyrosine-phosphatase [Arcobacteraceae bacterium]